MQLESSSSPTTPDELSKPGRQSEVGAGIDPELFYEERLGTCVAENDALRKDKKTLQNEVSELTDRLGRLQENNVS